MLTQLTISNFAIVRELDIDFQTGMTAITGETGAGKSIAIDAIGLCLGDRAESNIVRSEATRADLCARFQLAEHSAAKLWLEENQLEEQNECLLRRVISTDGRSKAFINGTAVPLSQLRELGQLLIQVHGQHAHQQLLKPEYQKRLLDAYGDHSMLLAEMRQAYQQWHQSCCSLAQYQQQITALEGRKQLLEYQLKELHVFNPQEGEYQKNDHEYKRLSNSGQLISIGQSTLQLLQEDERYTVLASIHAVKQQLSELVSLDESLNPLMQMIDEAAIQLNEVSEELRHYTDRLELDPERLDELEQRLSRQLTLARKHHIQPEKLPELYQQLLHEQQQLLSQEQDVSELNAQIERDHQYALKIAQQLHDKRSHHANELAQEIEKSMQLLSMPHGRFEIYSGFNAEHLSAVGASHVEFRVTTNPGQPMQLLSKVVSGGELSRIALAIQVITAKKMDTPALIFDEVDVGISGATAATVGQLLRELGESTQVICVTHLPQVAGNGNHHFFVSKHTDGEMTETQMQYLSKKERLQEIARLLGGSEVTRNTLANAKELLIA